MVAVRPAIAAYRPSWASSQVAAMVGQLPAAAVSSRPTAYTTTPPATQIRRRPHRLRVRSHSAPNTERGRSSADGVASRARSSQGSAVASSTTVSATYPIPVPPPRAVTSPSPTTMPSACGP